MYDRFFRPYRKSRIYGILMILAVQILVFAAVAFRLLAQAEEIPVFYDSREIGKSPAVRKQGRLGTCWAISACSALEAALQPGQQIVFSPDHLSLNNGFVMSQDDGGDTRMIMAYLAGWRGPVTEEEDPYGDGVTEEGLTACVHVQEIRLLDGLTQEEIKETILEYGPVQTSLCMDRRMTAKGKGYYNADEYAFYDPVEEKVSHDILILGWDDSFAANRFVHIPPADGAWICQNTWGTSFGDSGIFYVSYYDANILGTGLAYTKVESRDNYDRMYQTDDCGWQGRIGYDSETVWFANLYTALEDEKLKAVGLYSLGPDTDYEIFAVHNAKGSSSLTGMESIASGHLDGTGFFTVPVDAEVMLESGERFAVAARVTTKGVTKPAAVEMCKDSYTENVVLSGKEGYVSAEGIVWDDTEAIYGANICLKAYTDITGN